MREELWAIYKASGADPDGADVRHLNPGEALYEVEQLRKCYDEALKLDGYRPSWALEAD